MSSPHSLSASLAANARRYTSGEQDYAAYVAESARVWQAATEDGHVEAVRDIWLRGAGCYTYSDEMLEHRLLIIRGCPA